MTTETWRSTHAGSSSSRRDLVEQRVAAGAQQDVEIGLAHEAGQHLGLVHPGADRPDHALRPQLGKRRVRLGDRGLPVFVRVVDEQDVDPVETEPLEALVDGPADRVAG